MPPRRGKTPKRIGRSHTPVSARKTPSARSASKQLEDDGSPEAFKTPKIPRRSNRATKTPGWFSPTEDTFKLPSPSQNRRVTRRSTVFNIPEFSSFIPIELSPRRTRRSVYQKQVKAPEKEIMESAAGRRSSIRPPKAKPPLSSRRSSVYKKKVTERIVDNLTDTKIVKPSSRPAQFSPIKTRHQSMLPKAVNIQPVKPVVAPRKKVIEAPGIDLKGSVAAQKAVPVRVNSVQRATMSSAAKAKPKSKSPVVVKRASSATTSLKSHAVKRMASSKETVFVKDLVCLSPKAINYNSPNAGLHKMSSDIVLSPRGARTKTASWSVSNTDLVHASSDVSAKKTSVSKDSKKRGETPKTLKSVAPDALDNTSDQLATSPVDRKPPLDKKKEPEASLLHITSRDSLLSDGLSNPVVPETVSQLKSKTPSRTSSKSQLAKTTTRNDGAGGKTPSGTRGTETPSSIRKRRSAEKTPSTCSVAKKAKLDTSVYATPNFESPRVLLRKKMTSQIELSTWDTPEFLTPVGGNQMKAAFRKGTPMRPGMQNLLKLNTAQSSPSLNKKETNGIRPSATRKTRLATKQMSDQPVVETTVAVIDGGDILRSEEFNKSDGLDMVDAAQIKEPLELGFVKAGEETKQAQSGKCTIL